ncbi:glycosyltransferase [Aeromonas sp.]|uniref:glycosyltransferase n=1 Tax=Aeromonas sp. TaxID=647 RepID=UPI0025848EBD|nr:glycosyltransferase [Aeromonas sp.]MCX7131392.1 glycosyltransferase [Aeromonas sp.]
MAQRRCSTIRISYLGDNNKYIVGLINFSTLIKRTSGSFISSRENDWNEHVARILDQTRLNIRTNFLLENTIPSLSKQINTLGYNKFRLCILISNILPHEYKERIYSAAQSNTWIIIEERDVDGYLDAQGAISRSLQKSLSDEPNKDNLDNVTFSSFRLDDDDFLPNDYLSHLSKYITSSNQGKFVTFENGYQGLWNSACNKIENIITSHRPLIAIGLAHIGGYNYSANGFTTEPATVFAGLSHYDISNKYSVIHDTTEGMFFWSQHENQDTAGKFKSTQIKEKWNNIPDFVHAMLPRFDFLKKYFNNSMDYK